MTNSDKLSSSEAPPFPPHPGLAHELQESIERGDAASIGRRTLESCAYLAQTMLSQRVASFQVNNKVEKDVLHSVLTILSKPGK